MKRDTNSALNESTVPTATVSNDLDGNDLSVGRQMLGEQVGELVLIESRGKAADKNAGVMRSLVVGLFLEGRVLRVDRKLLNVWRGRRRWKLVKPGPPGALTVYSRF